MEMAAEEDADNSGAFNLDGGDSASFQSKKTDIFGSLDVLEKRYQSKVAARLESDSKRERDSQESRNGYDREEDDGDREFKRPRSPKAPRRNDFRSKAWSRRGDFSRYRNRRPDFEMNPDKWKKYSLEDTEVCGNAQNSRVAFDLIRQLRQRREEAEGLGEGSEKADLDQKIVFTKPTLTKSASSKTEKQTSSSYGSVHKMQEFNFGKKEHKAKSRGQNFEKSESVTGGNSLSLEHLDNEPGEELDMIDQSDDRSETFDQSEERSGKRDHSGLSKEEVPKEVREQAEHVSTEEVPASVSFKKRKGKRNIRSRQDEEMD